MASKRCLPTRFFKDADIMNVSKDGQLILVGLVLLADDEGRELAHPRLLSREIDYSPEQIEAALQELVENDLVVLYQVGKHCYYSLTRWSQWQTISSQKMTPSRYPAPSIEGVSEAAPTMSEEDQQARTKHVRHVPEIRREILGNAGIPQGNSGRNRESPAQLNLSESKLSESKSMEDEGETQPPPNIVPFPAARADADDRNILSAETEVVEATKQVASILNLPVTERLQRVVSDYLGDPSISLLGEADAAREWIEDPRRNRKRKPLTPAFFRCWLKREHEAVQRGYATQGAFQQETAGGTSPASFHATRTTARGIGPPGMTGIHTAEHAENPYQAFVSARASSHATRGEHARGGTT